MSQGVKHSIEHNGRNLLPQGGLPCVAERIEAPGVQDLRLNYDPNTLNLLDRWDATLGLREYFGYDALNRLTSAHIFEVDGNGDIDPMPEVNYQQHTFIYDGQGTTRGNMVQRTDIGKYTNALHRVTKAHGHDFPQDPEHPPQVINFEFPQQITYTPFNQPATVSETVDGISYFLTYTYGNSGQRCKSHLTANGDPLRTIWYNGQHEKLAIDGSESIYEVHYIPSPTGICAILVIENGNENIYPVYQDQLGSIIALTDLNGDPVAHQNFDAWGRLRDPLAWGYQLGDPNPIWLYRGYTGHEHLHEFVLINMNGRVYDPLTARMLSPDNYVISSRSTQTFNRYAYALNNPLKFTDPDGEFLFPALIGAGISLITNGLSNTLDDRPFFNRGGSAFFLGALGGAASFGIGNIVAGMSGIGKVAFQTLSHGHLGGLLSSLSNSDYGSGFLAGAFGSLSGYAVNPAISSIKSKFIQAIGASGAGAIMGGIGAELGGGSFLDGARNGAISAGLNHGIHAGFFGKGMMMASITGQFRHILGPDARIGGVTADAQFVQGVTGEAGALAILRGPDTGVYPITDGAWGVGLGLGVGIEVSDYYYAGRVSDISRATFTGYRTEINLNVTVEGVTIGITGTYAKINGVPVYGIGQTAGGDLIPFKVGGSLNWGTTNYWSWESLFK